MPGICRNTKKDKVGNVSMHTVKTEKSPDLMEHTIKICSSGVDTYFVSLKMNAGTQEAAGRTGAQTWCFPACNWASLGAILVARSTERETLLISV